MVRNEVDRFGFSNQIQLFKNLQLLPQKATCSWVHGWKWFDIIDERLLGCYGKHDKFRTKIVANDIHKEFLISKGFKFVHSGGLPFSYSLKSDLLVEIEDFKDKKIIAICPKSQENFSLRKSFDNFLISIFDDTYLRENVVLCIFSHNFDDPLIKHAVELKIPIIKGADPHNKIDLIRIKSLFKNFRYMITNTVGSHIPYCAALGLSIKIMDPFDVRSYEDIILNHSYAKNDSAYFDYLVHVHSKEYFFKKYDSVFVLDEFSDNLLDWGYEQIGYKFMLDLDIIVDLFGWTFNGKMRSLKEALVSRIMF